MLDFIIIAPSADCTAWWTVPLHTSWCDNHKFHLAWWEISWWSWTWHAPARRPSPPTPWARPPTTAPSFTLSLIHSLGFKLPATSSESEPWLWRLRSRAPYSQMWWGRWRGCKSTCSSQPVYWPPWRRHAPCVSSVPSLISCCCFPRLLLNIQPPPVSQLILQNSAFQHPQLSSYIFFCRLSSIRDIYTYIHYMMF